MTEPAKDEAELVERVAVATCECGGNCFVMDGATWCSASNQDSVIATLAAIRAAGWAVVPVEPTEKMFDAGHASSAHGHGIVALYRAMLAAAPGVKP
jgi:hypothetical protein